MEETSLKKNLNVEQLQAVEHQTGPLLIVAGAGTGKTTVVTERIKWLIGTGLAKPEEILALTFTEKAASEMATRVDVALPYGTFGLWVSTFHSFADRILRNEALHIGLSPNFKLMTEAEKYLFIKKHFWKFELKFFRPSGNPYKFIEAMSQHFDRLKDEDVSPKVYQEIVTEMKKKNKDPESEEEIARFDELARAYQTYESLKADEGVMDFSDLLSNTLELFRTRKSVIARYRTQFKYFLIDEFQDTNYAQYQLIQLLAPPSENPNLAVVGDDSQSIYKFRGAAISNILSFMKDYPKAKQVILTTNYRSAKPILEGAYRLIKKNDPYTLEAKLNISKNLTSGVKLPSEPIELIYVDRVEEEVEQIAKRIKELRKLDKKLDWKDFAILLRANNHSEPFIRTFEREKIPFQFLGPGMLFRQSEVKDLIAYLKILVDFSDSMSLYRVLSMDMWNLSGKDLAVLLNHAKKTNVTLFDALEKVSEISGISGQGLEVITDFTKMVHRHLNLVKKETAGQLLYYFMEDSGLLKTIVDFKNVKEEKTAANITKFFDKLKSYETTHEDSSVFALIDYIDLAMSVGESPLAAEIDWSSNNAVNLLTVHSAKGLEFPVVFLVNLIEGRFPSRERKEAIPIPDETIHELLPEGDWHLQEERRLFYVGMTRAQKRLILTAANFYGEGKRERKLTPFIFEALGEDFVAQKLAPKKAGKQLPLFEWSQTKDGRASEEIYSHKVEVLSYSAIETFEVCPLHYKLKNILKIPTPPTAAQAMGNSVHLALKTFYEESGDLLTILDKCWIKDGYSSKAHEEETKTKARVFLQKYLETDLHKRAKPLFLEKNFSFWIDKSLKVIGKIDRIDDLGDGQIEIIDYKTGANVPTQKEIDKSLQMTLYALAATNKDLFNKPVEKIKLTFYYFDNGEKISTIRTTADLKTAGGELLKIKDTIEQSDFKCSHSIFCQNCEFKMLCNE